jgi:DNA repair protein RadC
MSDLMTDKVLLAPLYHLELVRDRDIPYQDNVKTTEAAAQVLHNLLDSAPTEQLAVLYLDSSARIVGAEKVGMGGVEQVGAHPAEIFRGAIVKAVPEIILCHNHPDGVVEPSTHDLNFTLSLVQLGAMLGIRVRDHIIVGPMGKHLSMREHTDRLGQEMEREYRMGGLDGVKKKLLTLLDPAGKNDIIIDDGISLPPINKKGGDPQANANNDWQNSLSYLVLGR